jgi:hypothetical protein
MFCAPVYIIGGTEGVRSRFHVLRSLTYFRRCRVCRVPFSCFARSDMFSAVPRASGPVFLFCAPGLIFSGTEGVGSRFHVFRSKRCFRRCRVRRVPFSCFVRPDSFSAVPRATGPVFIFYAPEHVFGGAEGVGQRFHDLRAALVFRFCAPEIVSRGTEGVESRFQVLRSQTRFRRYRGNQVPFSNFALPKSFSA